MTAQSYTPDIIARYGYTPIALYPNSYAIALHWSANYQIATHAGLQSDNTYLYNLDLDSHHAGQDATHQLARIQTRLGPTLSAKLAIRRSRNNGYHLIFKTRKPLSHAATVKVYDPLYPTCHIGELIGPGQRIILSGDWLQNGPDSIPLLTAAELDQLKAAIHTPALYRSDTDHTTSTTATSRNQYISIGLSYIAGYEHITNWRGQLERLCREREIVRSYYHRLTTHHDRSAAYAGFLQSLMLHAWSFGTTREERCRMVAAIAIHTGAAGKEDDQSYDIERDTAALIARILAGATYENNEKTFLCPRWATTDATKRARSNETRSTRPFTPKPAGRPTGDRARRVSKALRTITCIEPDSFGRRFLEINDLATKLHVSRRSAQSYVAELRQSGHIRTGQLHGNGDLYFIVCGDANNTPLAPPEPREIWDADGTDEQRTPTLETHEKTTPCIGIGTPKIPAPPDVEPVVVEPPAHLLGGPDHASYTPQCPIRKPPQRQRLEQKQRRSARWDAMSIEALQAEYHKLTAIAAKTRHRAQRVTLEAQARRIKQLIGRKRGEGLAAMLIVNPELRPPEPERMELPTLPTGWSYRFTGSCAMHQAWCPERDVKTNIYPTDELWRLLREVYAQERDRASGVV